MSKRWEEQLFEAIREGDELAFERIYDLYQTRVRLVAWKISHRGDWVDEIGAMHALIGAISMEHWSQCSG